MLAHAPARSRQAPIHSATGAQHGANEDVCITSFPVYAVCIFVQRLGILWYFNVVSGKEEQNKSCRQWVAMEETHSSKTAWRQ